MEKLDVCWDTLPAIDRKNIADAAGASHRWDWAWSEMDEDMRGEMIAADDKNNEKD